MAFDDIFEHLSGAGWYQVSLYLLLGIPSFHGGLQTVIMSFIGPDQDHWCYVDKLTCFPNDQYKHIAIPLDENGDYDRCSYYDLPYDNYTYEELANWNRSLIPDDTAIIACDQGWYFDQTQFVRTVLMDYELVCDRSVLVPFSMTVVIFTRLILVIIAPALVDKFGRRPLFLIGACTHLIFVFGSAYAQTYATYVIMRSFLFNSVALTYELGFVFPLEIFSPSKRYIPGGFYWCFWSFGFMSVSAMAYFIRDSQKLQLAAGMPLVLHLSFLWLLSESPRWQLTMGRTEQCTETLRFVAEVNGDHVPDSVYDNLEPEKSELEVQQEESLWLAVKVAVQNKRLLKNFFLIIPAWAGGYLVYYGLSLNTGALQGNFYLNTALSGFVEIPANLLCMYTMQRFGRKPTQAWSLILAGVGNLLCIPLINASESLNWLLIFFNMFSKASITIAFTTVCVYTVELFPTGVRALAYNFSALFGILCAMLAPFMGIPLIKIWPPLPLIIFGLLGIGAGICVFFLPDTAAADLPDSINDAAALGTDGEKRRAKDAATHVEAEGDNSGSSGYDSSSSRTSSAAARKNQVTPMTTGFDNQAGSGGSAEAVGIGGEEVEEPKSTKPEDLVDTVL